ncbi:MAG: histidine--tRNA ligase [Lentisphaerae bacterium]|nr:histidine--tRNA ligase [Lentisphaerota bacterium]
MNESNKMHMPPRGMRDFYPDDMRIRNAIFNAWRQASLAFGFDEYDACVVESLDLLIRKAGEEIVEQIYSFKDKSGRDLALRPEMTPTLARMIAARQGSLGFPLKWFTIAQCFRYERMTRGRKREHYQWNLDIVGEESVTAETEIIATAVNALKLLGLDKNSLTVRFSSRELLAELLAGLGIERRHYPTVFLTLDKRRKINDTETEQLLINAGIDAGTIKKIFSLLQIESLDQAEKMLATQHTSEHAMETIRKFMTLLDTYGISDMVAFDISVVRGLAYYTGIVFEAFDTCGEFRAVFGGGRYDNLLSDIGGKPATGVGLGFGDVVIAEILSARNKSFGNVSSGRMEVGYMEETQRITAMKIAASFRKKSYNVGLSLKPEKAKAFFSRAGKSGAQQAVFIGPDDIASGSIRLKNLISRLEERIPLSHLCDD